MQMTAFASHLAIGALLFAGSGPSQAQEPPSLRPYAPGTPQYGVGGTPDRPARAVLRQDEDWSWLSQADAAADMGPLDRLKAISLGPVTLSYGFDGRIGFERFSDEGFGDQPGTDTSLHLRANPYASLAWGDRARLYGALKFGQVEDRRFPTGPADDDGPDIHQLFVEVSFGDAAGLGVKDALVRVGRQELHYGAGRLISIRNGPNVRFDFNGALARVRAGSTVGDVFAMRPSENDPGPWDNGVDESQAVWGLYTTTALSGVLAGAPPLLARSNLDLFYIGYSRDESLFAFGPAPFDETRHTFGGRLWSAGAPTDGFNYEIEAGLQTGRAESDAAGRVDIRAGYVAGGATYGLADTPWTPILGLRVGISSGDDDPIDDDLTTFRAPFPPGRYFGESNPLGPGNLAGFGPSIAISPAEGLTLTLRDEAFWRLTEEDGIYNPPQLPLRVGVGGERYVGHEISLIVAYALDDHTILNATLSRFETGPFLDDAGPGEDITYAQIKLDFAF